MSDMVDKADAWDGVAASGKRAREKITAMRQVVQNVIDGNYPMKRGKIHRADGTLSKYDTCIHGAYVYEGCETCISDYLEAALEKDASK